MLRIAESVHIFVATELRPPRVDLLREAAKKVIFSSPTSKGGGELRARPLRKKEKVPNGH